MGEKKPDGGDKKASEPARPSRAAIAQHAAPGTGTALPPVAELGNRAALAALAKLGRGAPLEPTVRRDMETRFAADFSDVRIHDGPAAATLAMQHRARAFTVDRNIVFARGELSTSTTSGRRLIAHELGHVRQQARGRETGGGSPRTASEADANRAADAVTAGAAADVREAAPLSIQKDEPEPTFSADTVAMAARIGIVNDGGEVTGTLDGHRVLHGWTRPEVKVGFGVAGNSVVYYIDTMAPEVEWTPDAKSFILEKAPGWHFSYRVRTQELPNLIDPFPLPGRRSRSRSRSLRTSSLPKRCRSRRSSPHPTSRRLTSFRRAFRRSRRRRRKTSCRSCARRCCSATTTSTSSLRT